MTSKIFNPQSRFLCLDKNQKLDKLWDFRSHKQKIHHEQEQYDSLQQRFTVALKLKNLVHQWLQFQKQMKHAEPTIYMSNLYSSLRISQIKQENLQEKQKKYSSKQQERNPLSQKIVDELCKHHAILKRINFSLAETLINIGEFKIYKKNQEIPHLFYDEKHRNQSAQNKRLGFIIYGKLKIYDKINDFQKTIDQTDCLGEHAIKTLQIKFEDFKNYKVKCIDEEAAIIWIQKPHYEILFKQSMKCGLKEQIRKLESHLKLSWIKKSLKKN